MSMSQVNCSGKTARKGRLYQQKHETGERIHYDLSARPQKSKPIELIGLFKSTSND